MYVVQHHMVVVEITPLCKILCINIFLLIGKNALFKLMCGLHSLCVQWLSFYKVSFLADLLLQHQPLLKNSQVSYAIEGVIWGGMIHSKLCWSGLPVLSWPSRFVAFLLCFILTSASFQHFIWSQQKTCDRQMHVFFKLKKQIVCIL